MTEIKSFQLVYRVKHSWNIIMNKPVIESGIGANNFFNI